MWQVNPACIQPAGLGARGKSEMKVCETVPRPQNSLAMQPYCNLQILPSSMSSASSFHKGLKPSTSALVELGVATTFMSLPHSQKTFQFPDATIRYGLMLIVVVNPWLADGQCPRKLDPPRASSTDHLILNSSHRHRRKSDGAGSGKVSPPVADRRLMSTVWVWGDSTDYFRFYDVLSSPYLLRIIRLAF